MTPQVKAVIVKKKSPVAERKKNRIGPDRVVGYLCNLLRIRYD